MSESGEQGLQRAIATISQSDPLIKLLHEVRLGRMKPTDTGLRAVTECWLETYRKELASGAFTKQGLRRLDPQPRLALLVDTSIISADHPAVTALRTAFEQTFTCASE